MDPQTDAKFKRESQGNSDKRGIQHKRIQTTGEKQSQMGLASLTSKAATSQHCEGSTECPYPAGLCDVMPFAWNALSFFYPLPLPTPGVNP